MKSQERVRILSLPELLIRDFILFSFIVFALLTLINCSGSKNFGEKTIVEESGLKPSWVGEEKIYWEDDDKMFYKATVTDQVRLERGLRNCKAELVKSIVEKISIKVTSDFTKASVGSNYSNEELGEDVKDVLSWTTDELQINGITPEELFWEKIEVYEGNSVSYLYDIEMLASINTYDYQKALKSALDKLTEQKRIEAQERARKLTDGEQK